MKLEKLKDNNDLNQLTGLLKKQNIHAVGKYLFGEYHIQISEHKLSGSERVSRLYHRRREEGRCVVCNKKVIKKNQKTGKLYRLCKTHREEIDLVKRK